MTYIIDSPFIFLLSISIFSACKPSLNIKTNININNDTSTYITPSRYNKLQDNHRSPATHTAQPLY